MALTESNMLPLGTVAPNFHIMDTVSNNYYSLDDLKSNKATVVMFICNHCPYVIHLNAGIVALANEFPFPYLYDKHQEVAKAYDAACTPDFYVFDGEMKLAYRGRFDASRPGNSVPVTGDDLRAAIDATLKGEKIEEQHLSVGCGIKWKK